MDVAMNNKPASTGKQEKKEENFFVFLIKLVAIVVVFRSFIFSPFNIPSESMLPGLVNGDYLLAAKWPYGFSSYSLPFSAPLLPNRLLAHPPKRGDVVIFKAPPLDEVDYIKRVIGLPGDTVQMRHGQLWLNGQAVPKVRIDDFEVAVSPNTHCFLPRFEATRADSKAVCHYPRYRETLPAIDGQPARSYNVLDLAETPQDDTPPVLVPEGTLFMMGDNRDNSEDSRFPAMPNEGVGLVPQENLVGRATVMMWSTDGSASWFMPWTWLTAARWNRIGMTF
jgi:signal peptidase I